MSTKQKLANAVANMNDQECTEVVRAVEIYVGSYQPAPELMTAFEKMREHGLLTEDERAKSAQGRGLSV